MECIFCNIVEKKSEAEVVFEDEHLTAFLDIRPINFGHTLVVPKKHYDNFLTVPKEEIQRLISATQFVAGAVKRSMNAEGFNIISNNGDSAGQTVYHFHFHIVPRFSSDFNLKPSVKEYEEDRMRVCADQIRSFISKYRNIYNG